MEGDAHVFEDGMPSESEQDGDSADSEVEDREVAKIMRTIKGLQKSGSDSVRDVSAARERLKSTALVPIELPADAPAEHPALMEAIALYDKNLVPDEAFRAMVEGEEAHFRELIQRGGMLNRSRPNDVERPYYPACYEPAHDQMHRDLTGQSGRPGRYQMMGLRGGDKEGLVAWMTFRLPPRTGCAEEAEEAYQGYMRKVFSHVKLRGITREALPPFSSMMEIDTINVKSGWKGAGTKLLAETLGHLHASEGEECPQHIYYYRFSRLSLRQPVIGAETRLFSGGENTSSAQLFSACGFDHIGHRQRESEVVAREVANINSPHVVVLNPMWEYGLAQFTTAQELAERRLERFYGVRNS
ncbi:MAG: hypothetical protein Q7S29_00375 [Candidatus Peribacter sp.]|nr:hypothetical protein [Candidatus Peribacter sp.]